MSQSIDLKQLERRFHRESLQDGIMEIAIGALMYLCGLLIADPKIIAIYVPYLVFFPRALAAAKKRYTYPRLGKVVLRMQQPRPVLAAALLYLLGTAALIATGLAVFGRLTSPALYRWLPVLLALCLSGVFWHTYSRSGASRYLPYSVVALAAAAVVSSIQLPSAKDYLAVYLICTGTLCALTGAVTLYRFARKYPPAAQEVLDENAQG